MKKKIIKKESKKEERNRERKKPWKKGIENDKIKSRNNKKPKRNERNKERQNVRSSKDKIVYADIYTYCSCKRDPLKLLASCQWRVAQLLA